MAKEFYYIASTKYSITERQTKKHGKVYDVYFRIIEPDTMWEKQKKLSGFKTKSDAKYAHDSFITQNCELIKDFPVKKKEQEIKPDLPTVAELIDRYIATAVSENKESVIYEKSSFYKNEILPQFGTMLITDITPQLLYQWQDKMRMRTNPKTNAKYSQAYVLKHRSFFSALLEWAAERYDYANPFKKVKRPKSRTAKKEMQFWTIEEFNKFISVVDNETYNCLFTLMFYTGRRKGELFAMSPKDITYGNPTKILFNKSISRKTLDGSPYRVTTTKKDKSDIIPICRKAEEAIKAYKGGKPFYFGGETPLAEITVTRAFDKYCEKAGVKRIRIHDLRHSFVSMAIHYGANINVVAALISDDVAQVFKTYGHLYETDKINFIQSLNDFA